MTPRKAAAVAFIIMIMFLGILIFIAELRPGSLVIMAYCFAVPGIVYASKLLYKWLITEGRR